MNAKIYALIAAPILAIGALAVGTAFAPGGVFGERIPRDYSDKADRYCAEGVAFMRTVPGFEDFAGAGFPAVTARGERPAFSCPARSWRGAFIVRVEGRCAIPAKCTRVEVVEDEEGRIVYSGEV